MGPQAPTLATALWLVDINVNGFITEFLFLTENPNVTGILKLVSIYALYISL